MSENPNHIQRTRTTKKFPYKLRENRADSYLTPLEINHQHNILYTIYLVVVVVCVCWFDGNIKPYNTYMFTVLLWVPCCVACEEVTRSTLPGAAFTATLFFVNTSNIGVKCICVCVVRVGIQQNGNAILQDAFVIDHRGCADSTAYSYMMVYGSKEAITFQLMCHHGCRCYSVGLRFFFCSPNLWRNWWIDFCTKSTVVWINGNAYAGCS